MKRAYSILQIKAFDEDKREFEGVATTPTVDSYGDIVDPEGAEFDLPLPFLWQHNPDKPIGHITEAKVSKDGIEVKGKMVKTDEPGTLKERLDEAWQSMKLGLVRGLSIGFRSLEHAFIEGTHGIHFIAWKWLELSAVTIPANSDATIQTIKSIDSKVLAALGNEPPESKSRPGVTGINLKGKHMNIQEQIKGFDEARKEKAARMSEIMEKSAEKGETLDAELTEEYDTLEAEVKSIDKHLKRLKSLEAMNKASAEAVPANPPAPLESKGDGVSTVRAKQKLPPGVGFARLARCKALAKLDGESPRHVAKQLYGENSSVYGTLTKAPVSAATTSDSEWAGFLVGDESDVFADFVEFLRPQTIVGKFGTEGIPALRRVPFRTRLVGQTTGGQGYWVGEGKAKPLTRFSGEVTTLEPLKVANIAVATEEILRDSSPSADILIRDDLAAALRERMDLDFVDPEKSAGSNSPASITNGITPITSTGCDGDAVRCDLRNLWTQFSNANNPLSSGVLIMSTNSAIALSLMTNALGQNEFGSVTAMGGRLGQWPIIVSDYVPTDSNGHFVILVNAMDIWFGDEGGVNVDMSRDASLEMDDAPTNDSDTPTATQLVSMFQTDSVAFRAERTLNWARRRPVSVAVLDGVNWGCCEEESS